ncbi:uncharacterized protein LOC122926366, partial [Bufo gargarizans]|uniref:uncharacterized protein LOC122926366 n=1 Tax=Bufo gargarizans TaxID=30331 RepID=UPI001CF136F6
MALEETQAAIVSHGEAVRKVLQGHNSYITSALLHLEDQENRSRRKNVRIRGVPETVPPGEIYFERQCNLHRIDRGEWVAILSGKLSGKASDAFRTVPEQEIHSYARVKEVLLARYAVTPESYRQKFRDSRKTAKDSYVEWACQLSLSASNWVNSSQATTAENILQLMLLEQFYDHILTDVKDWVRDHRPMTLPEAAKLADEYADTRKTNPVTPQVQPPQPTVPSYPPAARYQPPNRPVTSSPRYPRQEDNEQRCFRCKQLGHYKQNCPMDNNTRSNWSRPGYRPPAAAHCVDSAWDPQELGQEEPLGTLYEALMVQSVITDNRKHHCQLVMVNGKTARGLRDSGATITLVQRHLIKASEKPGKSIAVSQPNLPLTVEPLPWDTPEDFGREATGDPSLRKYREKARRGQGGLEKEQFIWENGRLYRLTETRGNAPGPKQKRQLVVPRKYRQDLLRIGHDVPLAGHLGIRKTGYRVTQNFFWPGVSDDVRAYCQTCEVCQRIGKKGDHPKAKLVSMPIIEEPFTRVAVDIIGPLAQPSRSGKRYILTIVDYATRYPEAVALSNIQAETVAEALVKVFSRVGFPKEVLSDQGTQFTAEVTQQIWKTCGVKSLTSSPYHPQTNSLCERFNGTLKQMLKSFTGAYKDWERFLPHLLFAYREVPQESTGFSPFELLYGRRVRGPLDLIKDHWEGQTEIEGTPVVPYVLELRDRMEELAQTVRENLRAAQQRQRVWYDRRARHRSFQIGQKVMVLRPVRTDKLQAAWQGPYKVIGQICDTTYTIASCEDEDVKRTFHINMLKAYQEREIDEMLQLGVIEPSESPWASPVVLVPKKDGTTRFCVDYRRLNDKTVTDAYPMPRMDELLDRISAGKYLTTIDLCKGYWQIPLAEDAIPKSAFITPFGLYQFRVMPFGMKNAPATFQRMVDQLLGGLQSFACAYLDDIAIHSDTWEAHLEHIGVVLDRIRGAGLTLKPDKCHLGMAEVQYLGHRVGCGKQRPEPAKIEAVANWPTPHTKTQVMAFLGTAGYYRRFVPDYSALAKPLTDLTKKKLPRQVLWSPECEVAFQALKTALVNAPVLVTPDPNKRFIVHTDASMFGLGAVLSQIGEDGGEHPVAYLSRKLLPREVSYATIEKECLALVWALKKLTPYLYGRAFTLITDHNPLVWLNRVSGDNARLLRWSLALQP